MEIFRSYQIDSVKMMFVQQQYYVFCRNIYVVIYVKHHTKFKDF